MSVLEASKQHESRNPEVDGISPQKRSQEAETLCRFLKNTLLRVRSKLSGLRTESAGLARHIQYPEAAGGVPMWRKTYGWVVGAVEAGLFAVIHLASPRYAQRWRAFIHRIVGYHFETAVSQIGAQVRCCRIAVFPELPLAVSVLIPTRNAGPEFDRCLRAIREQQGLRSLELIVIDSSSTDGTPELARKYGARVTIIPVESFDHGATRNDLAGLAAHPILFFTVQDAVLLGHHALRDLAAFLLDTPRCAAVNARQVPRTDADLFASFSIWSHQLAMEWNRDQVRNPIDPVAFQALPPAMRRRLAALDNVCCIVRRDAWESIRFRESFEEDLDFGQRCLETGWSLGYAHSIGVAHSHNRPAEYHLRRGVIDSRTVFRILNETGTNDSEIAKPGEVATIGRWFIRILSDKLNATPQPPLDLLVAKARDYCTAGAFETARRDSAISALDADLAEMERLLSTIYRSSVSDQALRILTQGWRDLFSQQHLHEFCRGHRWAGIHESRSFLVKLVAGMIGVRLGKAVSFHGLPEEQFKAFTSGI